MPEPASVLTAVGARQLRLQRRILDEVIRVALILSLACVIGGLIWMFAVGTLLGMLLIIGGVMALVVMMAPTLIEQFAVFLSTGKLRRR